MHDFFLTLGVERTFGFESAALERHFHTLQRNSHPDRFARAESGILGSALERSSEINEAYRTLRNPLKRMKYLLSLYGYSIEQSKQVPMDLLELVINAQEKVTELESVNELQKEETLERIYPLIDELEQKRMLIDDESQELAAQWDKMLSHSDMKENISEKEKMILEKLSLKLASRAYISTLLDSLNAAIKGESLVLRH